MAATMDIRLDYGAWPGDEGDTTDSTTTREASPAFYHPRQGDELQQELNLQRRENSILSLTDFFSDSDSEESAPDQDLLEAETHMPSTTNTSQNTSNPVNPPPATNSSTPGQLLTYEPAVIDLTESPPQPSIRPTTTPWRTFPPSTLQEQPTTMPPTLRSGTQSRRAPEASSAPLQTDGRPRKRRRLSETARRPEQTEPDNCEVQEIEAVDLTEINDNSDLSRAISKQQQDAVQAQMKETQREDLPGRTPLSSYKCPICMDTPEDATSTICGKPNLSLNPPLSIHLQKLQTLTPLTPGHLFCHKCIIDTLRFSQQQRRDDAGTSKAKGTCPVCRKPLARKDEPGNGRTLVPLEIKLSTRRDLKGKGVAGRNKYASSAVPGRMRAKTERETSADMWRDLTTLEHG
jgi:Zinc finger, C3HC4 type (RING finger)